MTSMEVSTKTEQQNSRGRLVRVGVGVSGLALLAACSGGSGESQNTASTVSVTTTSEAGRAAASGFVGHPEDISKPVIRQGERHTMTQQYDAQTFTDYRDASHRDAAGKIVSSDQNPTIQAGKQYEVDCFQAGPAAASPSAAPRPEVAAQYGLDGTQALWYHITGSDGRLTGLYVAANTAWNQMNPGGPDKGNIIDPLVLPCHPEDVPGYKPAPQG